MKHEIAKTGLRALILALLFYIVVPSLDDLINIPIIASIFSLPLYAVIIIYYGAAWMLIFLIEKLW